MCLHIMVVILHLYEIKGNSCQEYREIHMDILAGCKPFASKAEEEEKNNGA